MTNSEDPEGMWHEELCLEIIVVTLYKHVYCR